MKAIGFILLLVVVPAFSEATTIAYIDKLGRKVTIDVPVKRAVFLISYELLPCLGVWDKVVGVSRWAYDNDLIKAAKPDIEKTIPAVGSSGDINIEALLKLRPDVVIAWTFRPQEISFMEKKGLNVIAIYPESLQELYNVMRLQGRLFGKEEKVESSIVKTEELFSLIRKKVSKIPNDKRKKVLWLGSRPTTVACGVGVVNDVFNLIGGINPAATIPQRSVDVSIERIIEWNPDVIFIWGNAAYNAKDILNSPQFRSIRAVKDKKVYKAPEWSTWSPRVALIALWMAAKTYPEYLSDIDFEKVADRFYRDVFGIPYRLVKGFE